MVRTRTQVDNFPQFPKEAPQQVFHRKVGALGSGRCRNYKLKPALNIITVTVLDAIQAATPAALKELPGSNSCTIPLQAYCGVGVDMSRETIYGLDGREAFFRSAGGRAPFRHLCPASLLRLH